MDRRKIHILGLVLAAFALAGCSEYSKLLKSKDRDKMYSKALEYYQARKYSKTIALYEDIEPYFDGTARGDTIKFYKAASYYNQGDFETSGMLFEEFRRTAGRNNPFSEEAEYMYAMGFYYASPVPERDQGNTIKAMLAIGEYLDRYPNSPKKEDMERRVGELQRKIYDKEYLNSKTYYNIGYYKSAVVALRNALDDSPENPHREEMMYLIAKSGYLLAANSVHALQKDRYLKMMDYYYSFVSEYPASKYGRELEKMLEEAKQYLEKNNTDNQENTTSQNGTEKE